MKISTRGRYALRVLVDLAEHNGNGFVTLKDIAERQNISKKYLEQIVPALTRSGIIRSNRGLQGGYVFVKEPSEVTVGDVLRLSEGNMAPVACLECTPNLCERRHICPTLPVWTGLQKVITEYLDSITIEDIVEGRVSNNVL